MHDTQEDYASLMEEAPGGQNHGSLDGQSLDVNVHRQYDLRFTKTFGITSEGHGGTKGNRAVLSPDEYVDRDTLTPMVEEELGFTLLEVRLAYGYRGYQPPERRALRNQIDARILELYQTGANMVAFAQAIGINTRTMDRVLVRAQKENA